MWQQKYRVDWDATDGRNGGAQRTVWEVLMDMETYEKRAGKQDQGAVALILDLAKAFPSEPASLWCGRGQCTSASQVRFCVCCADTSSTRGDCNSKDV